MTEKITNTLPENVEVTGVSNFEDEERLATVAGDIESLGLLIDAFLAQIQHVGAPSEDSFENVRGFLAKRFDEIHDNLHAISENNYFVKR